MTYSRLAATCLAATLLFAGSLFGQREIPFDSAGDFLHLPDDIYFGEVAGVATTSTGHLFVYTQTGGPNATIGASRIYTNGGPRLFEFDSNGTLLREIGKGDVMDRPYGFLFAEGVRVDAQDNIWTVDRGSTVVIKFDPTGRVVLTLGRRPEAVGAEGSSAGGGRRGRGGPPGAGSQGDAFNQPTDVAWDAAGNIFISDGYRNNRIAKFDKNGKFIKTWGSTGDQPGQFNVAASIAVDARGNVYVADHDNNRIQVFDNDGTFQKQITNVGSPLAICISPGAHQYLYSSNSNPTEDPFLNGEIYKLELDGTIIGKFGHAGKQFKEFGMVNEIDCRDPNTLYVGERMNWRVQKITLH